MHFPQNTHIFFGGASRQLRTLLTGEVDFSIHFQKNRLALRASAHPCLHARWTFNRPCPNLSKRLLQFPKFGLRGCWLSKHLSTFPSKNLLAPRFKLMRNIITNPEKILSRSDGWILRRLDSFGVVMMIIWDMITFPPQ